MALLLEVPYAEKEEAKALGARWNKELKKWYVEDYRHYPDFFKWIEPKQESVKQIICNAVYVVEAVRTCNKCKKETPVIGFGLKNFVDIEETVSVFYDFKEDLRLVPFFEPMPKTLLQYVKEKYNFDKRYSHTIKAKYYANGCKHCGALQGQFFLFDEVGSPFEVESADKLSIYKFPLQHDIVADDIEEGTINIVPYDEKLVCNISTIMDN